MEGWHETLGLPFWLQFQFYLGKFSSIELVLSVSYLNKEFEKSFSFLEQERGYPATLYVCECMCGDMHMCVQMGCFGDERY